MLLDLELPVRQAFHALHEQVRLQSSARSCKDCHAAQQRTNTMQQGPCSGVQAGMRTVSGKGSIALQLVPNALQYFWLSPTFSQTSMRRKHAINELETAVSNPKFGRP